jgi:hypothetical protein
MPPIVIVTTYDSYTLQAELHPDSRVSRGPLTYLATLEIPADPRAMFECYLVIYTDTNEVVINGSPRMWVFSVRRPIGRNGRRSTLVVNWGVTGESIIVDLNERPWTIGITTLFWQLTMLRSANSPIANFQSVSRFGDAPPLDSTLNATIDSTVVRFPPVGVELT